MEIDVVKARTRTLGWRALVVVLETVKTREGPVTLKRIAAVSRIVVGD